MTKVTILQVRPPKALISPGAAPLFFHYANMSMQYYRVITLISANIVPSLDIEGRELASVRRYPNEGQYSPISVR